ncbi:phospho-N-acetylmuramoyl-pentapeptide-transferase [Alkalibacter mobilis]|uniref:phospho-N-acetylmuramoyl-pentapeptide- transferase n=1 Tax=Alkalibacter mobilis TaxID=2787712 RepID=UPI00189DDDF7|nr:phospho-N-acetylmuramoyl-pentapeptide-transferase [Alkalibacter mobilis]MBF7097127.1 phospho-N-acetylmuramoyl-pentapeptide-transferase [Alkalibacter mobilis]
MTDVLIWLITGLLAALVLGPITIPILTRMKFGQTIREEGPKSHMSKGGTPTMGGVIFIFASIIGTVVFSERGPTQLMILTAFTGFGLIGFIDDYIKVVLKRNLGLRAWQKILMQFVLAIVLVVWSYKNVGTELMIPFMESKFDLGLFYIPFGVFVVLAFVNAVNLTDGLDGLASGVSVFSFIFFIFASFIVNVQAVRVFSATAIGALLGFLKFNFYPARVFMGDTGSMALGGAVSALILLTGSPLVMLLGGGVFFMETLSVVIQVAYFKVSGGKRIFKMTPIHHHFELSGWSEVKVVLSFWCVAAVCALLAIASII